MPFAASSSAWFESYDLIICPASNRAPITLDYEPPEGREAARRGGGYTSEYNTTGWPAGVVRAGTSTADARACRSAFRWWRSPGVMTWCSPPPWRISKSRRVGGRRRRSDGAASGGSARWSDDLAFDVRDETRSQSSSATRQARTGCSIRFRTPCSSSPRRCWCWPSP